MSELPQFLIDPTEQPLLPKLAGGDVLAHLLKDIRVSKCLQYCFAPHGDWIVDANPASFRPPGSVSFHIVVEGEIWIDFRDNRVGLQAGDVVIFPRGSPHFLGFGSGGRLISPGDDLPPTPWDAIPILHYEAAGARARLLCGFLEARVLDFEPLLAALPEIMIARTSVAAEDWLAPSVRRLIREIDEPSPGGMTIVARLSEIVFIELLRRQMLLARDASSGWLTALGDPVLHRALRALHGAPEDAWTQDRLAVTAGVSKTKLCERFRDVLAMSPMRYLRDWRLYLASAALADSDLPTLAIAERAGYGTEAAFSRAFARRYAVPPVTWRKRFRLESGPA